MPKVSILIPAYNVEPYLVQAMDSVVTQTLKDIEIICVNDGSTDGTLNILKQYAEKDDRIVIIDKENGGYGIGMNTAFAKATGEYIGILEPDDFIPPEMYKELYDVAHAGRLDFVKADFYRFITNENGKIEKTHFKLSQKPEDYRKVFNPSETPEALRWTMNTWCGIYRRAFLEENHILHNTTPGASYQDNGFWIQTFVYAKRAMIIDKPYYMNRRDNMGSSVHNSNKVYAINKEYDHIRDLLMRDPAVWERFKYMYWYKKYYSYDFTMKRIGEEFRQEYLDRWSREYRRAKQKGELSADAFTVFAWKNIHLLINNPKEFYEKNYADKGPANYMVQNQAAEDSSLKGKIKKRIPQPVKDAIKKVIGRA